MCALSSIYIFNPVVVRRMNFISSRHNVNKFTCQTKLLYSSACHVHLTWSGIEAFSIHSHVHSMPSSVPRRRRELFRDTSARTLVAVTPRRHFSLTTDLKPTEGSRGRQRIAFPTWTWKLLQLVECCSGYRERSTNAGLQFVFREQIALFTTCGVICCEFVSYQSSSSQKASFISEVQSRTESTIVPG